MDGWLRIQRKLLHRRIEPEVQTLQHWDLATALGMNSRAGQRSAIALSGLLGSSPSCTSVSESQLEGIPKDRQRHGCLGGPRSCSPFISHVLTGPFPKFCPKVPREQRGWETHLVLCHWLYVICRLEQFPDHPSVAILSIWVLSPGTLQAFSLPLISFHSHTSSHSWLSGFVVP